ncbi:unnamed protein product, partial [Discosporangium mesarthrocarpum]
GGGARSEETKGSDFSSGGGDGACFSSREGPPGSGVGGHSLQGHGLFCRTQGQGQESGLGLLGQGQGEALEGIWLIPEQVRLTRLSLRCVEVARSAASLLPPLSAVCLFPSAVGTLPHSCTPSCTVAADPGSYGGAPWGGRPLSAVVVALRDVRQGEALTVDWTESETRAGLGLEL